MLPRNERFDGSPGRTRTGNLPAHVADRSHVAPRVSWSQRRESNPWPRAYKARALPVELHRRDGTGGGDRTPIHWVRARCPTVGRLRCGGWGGAIRTLVSGFKDRGPASGRLPGEVERPPGVEPGSSGWKPDALAARPCPRDGATGENRTRAAGMGAQPSATDLRSREWWVRRDSNSQPTA